MPEHALKAASRGRNSDDDDEEDKEEEEEKDNKNGNRKRSIDDSDYHHSTLSKFNNNNSPKPKVDRSKSRLVTAHQIGSRILLSFIFTSLILIIYSYYLIIARSVAN